jgi:hypothetical protein
MSTIISYAGQYESTMAACGESLGETEYTDEYAAADSLSRFWPSDDRDYVLVNIDDTDADGRLVSAWLVYADQDAADRDGDGSLAIAQIQEVAS